MYYRIIRTNSFFNQSLLLHWFGILCNVMQIVKHRYDSTSTAPRKSFFMIARQQLLGNSLITLQNNKNLGFTSALTYNKYCM